MGPPLQQVAPPFFAGEAGDNDPAAMDTHPGRPARYKEGGAAPAELPAEFPVNPHPLAHRDLPGKRDIPVAQFGMQGKYCPRLRKEHRDPFAGDLLCLR